MTECYCEPDCKGMVCSARPMQSELVPCQCPCHSKIVHIRVPIRRAVRTSRNWVGLEGRESDLARTFCGDPVTDRDIDVRSALAKSHAAWRTSRPARVCGDCACALREVSS